MNVPSDSLSSLVPSNYVSLAQNAGATFDAKVRHLLAQRKIPDEGWSESDISSLLDQLSRMDSNNFSGNCGVGEREGRIFSGLVYRRHFGLAHGIGRSGDLCEVQPKATGSSVINRLTNALVLDLIRHLGVRSCQDCFVVPVATGMAMTLCLLSLKRVRPATAKFVIWSRIDQKACFKSISCAGLESHVLELTCDGDALCTDLTSLSSFVSSVGPENVLAVVTTSSCFAPRVPDDLEGVTDFCRQMDIPHVINNAYGLQSSKCMHLVEQAGRRAGPYDVFIQSTDKNLMVPVGGAIIAGFNREWVQKISQTYPGRASGGPSVDVLITLLSMGVSGYKKLCKDRKELFATLKESMQTLATKFGERIMDTRKNPISIAMTLEKCPSPVGELGSMLFTRNVSGARVIAGDKDKTIEGHAFNRWGSHSDALKPPYLTAAAAIGMTPADIDAFMKRLDKVMTQKYGKEKANKT